MFIDDFAHFTRPRRRPAASLTRPRRVEKGQWTVNSRWFRQFYLEYGILLPKRIHHAVRDKFSSSQDSGSSAIHHVVRDEFKFLSLQSKPVTPEQISHVVRAEFEIRHTPCSESWQPGQIHSNLAWTHYRTLLRVDKLEARSFYEIEAVKNNWSSRELERQINCLLYERLALSRDKKGLLRLARKGQEIREPLDVFKDPLVLEFLKIPAAAKLVESDFEAELKTELLRELKSIGPAPAACLVEAKKKTQL